MNLWIGLVPCRGLGARLRRRERESSAQPGAARVRSAARVRAAARVRTAVRVRSGPRGGSGPHGSSAARAAARGGAGQEAGQAHTWCAQLPTPALARAACVAELQVLGPRAPDDRPRATGLPRRRPHSNCSRFERSAFCYEDIAYKVPPQRRIPRSYVQRGNSSPSSTKTRNYQSNTSQRATVKLLTSEASADVATPSIYH